ncbi:hypothetical protein CMK11_12195 [Candidatus Poribacteria bacterium]|nr:hypothetical protein [Candidatus Poribacteria bacterium]
MRLVGIDGNTEATFFRCLHDEVPDDPRVTKERRRWYEAFRGKGLRAQVLILDTEEVVGLCQYVPIEHSHLIGDDLLAILCIWVHGYDHHVGNRQGNGYGRFILESIEEDARASGAKGVAAWGMDFEFWNPVSFYEHMGYRRVDQNGSVVLAWKPFAEDAEPPRLLRPRGSLPASTDRVDVVGCMHGWCGGGIGQCVTAREAVEGLADIVAYHEIDVSDRETMLAVGRDSGVFVDGEPFRPAGPPYSVDDLRAEIVRRAETTP